MCLWFFGCIASLYMQWYLFIFYSILSNCFEELAWCFVIKYVFHNCNPLAFQMLHNSIVCLAHFSGCSCFHGFNKDEIPVCWTQWELSYLFCVHDIFHVFNVDTYFLESVWWCMDNMCIFLFYFFLGGLYALLLLLHMPFLCFMEHGEVFCDGSCCEHFHQEVKKPTLITLSHVDLVEMPVAVL